jgi:mRNA-degrading endonuclease YafQ of YafQ-DinJ toxin-antitoxin module
LKRTLIRSNLFVRAAQRSVKKYPPIAEDIRVALILLSDDSFHPQLRTHKLKGKLQNFWACSAGYDLRIIFQFVQHEGKEAILLETIGTHDEVY